MIGSRAEVAQEELAAVAARHANVIVSPMLLHGVPVGRNHKQKTSTDNEITNKRRQLTTKGMTTKDR
jgi:hypothetical protein